MGTGEPDLLHGLDTRDADEVMALGCRLRLASGESLFHLGAEADRLFLIERGRIALTLPMHVYEQETDLLVEERQTGQTLGWSALIPPHRFTLAATAVVETELLVFMRSGLLDHFAKRPDVGYAVTRNVAAVVGQRLQVFQTMWLREMQRVVKLTYA
jgi:CRP/FNR family transcriptional regulator, cyclic AMP receptor protein